MENYLARFNLANLTPYQFYYTKHSQYFCILHNNVKRITYNVQP